MTPAERDLDALCEECQEFIRSYPHWNKFVAGHLSRTCINAFPAGARARLAMMKVSAKYIEKLHEASRLVSECEALQRGEGA